MSVVIQLNDGNFPSYWSLDTRINPAGMWTEKSEAVQFAREKDAQQFLDVHLRHQKDLCKVVPFN